ncbi:acyl-CoA thioesterase [Flavivirga jejuensis]|uniref:Acyl-CoA thioesterase n=1 Tax=Flavivirga jejuensis TaxID=870487 RepID=A0ABT8WMN2_9FLAO|nr:acyl-CoA thioesterase [Flavivirga jejuensis]MDO5974416.1 acyl-CoA thioesterase [Flavivirga jejuensis]
MPMIYTPQGACFEYRFKTTFEETNLVGNIYFANYVLWQGKCREMFLYETCPDVIKDINNGLSLITLDLSVQYISQLFAFDNVVMHMFLEAQSPSRLLMHFKYYKEENEALVLVCEGTQATASMREENGKMVSVPFPESMFDVFEEYEIM